MELAVWLRGWERLIQLRAAASMAYNAHSENAGGEQAAVEQRVSFLSSSPEITHALGVGLGQALREGDTVCLQGELGSGKTHLTKGIAAGLGVGDRVTSPTFVIANEYSIPRKRNKLYHIDLYRVESVAEAMASGLEEYWWGGDICVIEWAERITPILPADRLWVNLGYCGPLSRRLVFEACGPASTELLDRFQAAVKILAGRADSGEGSTCS